MSHRHFGLKGSKEGVLVTYQTSRLSKTMTPTIGLKLKVTWIPKAQPRSDDLGNTILTKNSMSSMEHGFARMAKNGKD